MEQNRLVIYIDNEGRKYQKNLKHALELVKSGLGVIEGQDQVNEVKKNHISKKHKNKK